MSYYEKYLKYKKKYLDLFEGTHDSSRTNSTQKGGSPYLFNRGDKFEYNGQTGVVIRIAEIDEFGGDFHFDENNYVVNFDGFGEHRASYNYGLGRYIMSERDMIKITNRPRMIDSNINSPPNFQDFNFVTPELGHFMTPKSEKPNSKKCIFAIDAKVSVSDVKLRLKNPFRDEYVKFRAGIISDIYPVSQYTNQPDKCFYEISFNDGTIAVEVPEEVIRKSISIDSSKNEGSKTDSETQTDSPLKPRQSNNSNYFVPSSPQSNNSNYFMPQNNKTDLLTAIALNNLSESIRDATYSPRFPNLFVETPYRYDATDVGENENLQKDVTDFFHNKTQKWVKEEHEFSKVKKHLKFIKSKKGNPYIYKLLKSFVKKNNVNWYELRGDEHYDDVKEYIRNKLASI
jgi:hypothetical protein